MTIRKVCKQEVISINEEASIQEAAKLMKDNNIGDVVVLKNDKPIGILTDRDIVIKLAADAIDINSVKVKDIMTANLLTLQQDQGIYEAIEAMRSKGVRRAPIIDQQGQIKGIATIDDMVVLLANELKAVSELLQKQAISA